MLKIIALTVALLLQACTTIDGPLYQPSQIPVSPEQATIVVMREWSTTGIAWPADFYLDRRLFAKLDTRGYFYTQVAPGIHQVSYGPPDEPEFLRIRLNATGGGIYYITLKRDFPDQLWLETPENAEKDLKTGDYRLQVFKH